MVDVVYKLTYVYAVLCYHLKMANVGSSVHVGTHLIFGCAHSKVMRALHGHVRVRT